MKILKYILFGIVALIAIYLLLCAFGPKTMKAERSVTINAPKAVVYEHVRTLKAQQAWSPWAERDPNMKSEYTGNDGEVGSAHAWDGNDQVGAGKQTITAVSEDNISSDLHFLKPFESHANSYINLASEGEATKVTWGFTSECMFLMRGSMLFMDMDAMIGKDFEYGMNKLKTLVESAPAAPAATVYEVKEVDFPAHTYVGTRKTIGFNDFNDFYGKAFPAAAEAISKAKVKITGAPAGIVYNWDEKAMQADVAAALPVDNAKAKVPGMTTFNVSAGKALQVVYYGAYDKSMDAHTAIGNYMKEKGMTNMEVIEEYVTDPMMEKDTAKWMTNIYYKIK